jgi:hypothetical protein
VESDRFDALTERLAGSLSRRRGVSLIGALGIGGMAVLQEADARKKKKRKKKRNKPTRTTTPAPTCTPCGSRTCGDDGCGKSCGTCEGDLVCRNGTCGCPEGMDLCGGTCHPACPPSSSHRVISRHPATCTCCVRPGTVPCPNHIPECCADLPCCAGPCDPNAVNAECPLRTDPILHDSYVCLHDVDCYPNQRCPEGNNPRVCEWI